MTEYELEKIINESKELMDICDEYKKHISFYKNKDGMN